MRKLRGNLHTHTIFSDGQKSVSEALDIYRSLDYDFVAITDHDFLVGYDYLSNIPESSDELIIFKGLEISEELLAGQHVGCIIGDRERMYVLNHPALYGLSLKQVMDNIEKVKHKYKIDCIDVSHYGQYTPQYDSELIPLPKIVSDDAHREAMFGKAWIEVEAEMQKDDILHNIKKGNFTKHFRS